jgi:hypothetical protein
MPRPLAIPIELRDGLKRVLRALECHLHAQREAGRGSGSDALRGIAIEPGDVERLLADIDTDLAAGIAAPSHAAAAPTFETPRGGEGETPLQRAARVFYLDDAAVNVLMLCIGVEVDARFARLVAFLNDHIARTRPTLDLALALFAPAVSAVAFAETPALRWRLLLADGDGPVSERTLRVAPQLLARLALVNADTPGLREDVVATIEELALPADRLQSLHRWSTALAAGPRAAPLVLAGVPGSGRATAIRAAARAGGRGVIEATWSLDTRADIAHAAREALWYDAVLMLRIPPEASANDVAPLWEALAGWPVPVALTIDNDAQEHAMQGAPAGTITWAVTPPTIALREALWRRLLRADQTGATRPTDTDIADLAQRFDFTPGLVAGALRRARAVSADGGGALDLDALSRACRGVGSARMSTIAHRLALPYTRSDLIVPRELSVELDLAIAWMRHRRQVFEDWNFGQRIALGRGMTALFAGAPGTGKTMAAQVLARELGLDLFRADLSRVMSKYIGETEKNLSRLFDDAAASGAVLFFDEADALFGKRSEVKDAHDRYANLEIGYLLQRMEEHEGISLLATNRVGDLDEAFTRRFHFILDFPLPRAPERRRIWDGMLPREAKRDADLSLDALSDDFEVSGGEIRNAVLSAAFAAAAEAAPIGLRHLKHGLRRELLKTGRVLDAEQRRKLAE